MNIVEKKLPVFKLFIEDGDQTGVSYVALVDQPAIERTWQMFESQSYDFKIKDKDKQIVEGALMIPGMPIYRRDSQGEYYVVFDAETIEKIVLKFHKMQSQANVNLMHDANLKADGVFMFESFVIDSKRGKNTPTGTNPLPDGTWYGSYKVENSKIWEAVKAGTFKGFSVEGEFMNRPIGENSQSKLDGLAKKIANLRAEIQELRNTL
jgi:hypothetical protein